MLSANHEMIMNSLQYDPKKWDRKSRNPKPFTSIKVLDPKDEEYWTLTKGMFQEIFEPREKETYGHFTVSNHTGKLLAIDTTSIKGFIIDPVAFAYDFGARMYDARVGQFISVDPLATKFPNQSPYSAFNGNPLIFVDPDGRSNIIYLIVLPDATAKMQNATAQDIANQANANFEKLGLKTRVIVIQKSAPMAPEFDPKNIDATDGIAILGGTKLSTENYIKGIAPEIWQSSYRGWSAQTKVNPERSLINGKLIALDASDFFDWADRNKKNLTYLEAVALLINHGAGHNAGNSVSHYNSSRINNDHFNDYKNNSEIFDKTHNQSYIQDMMAGNNYGDEPAKDNYSANAARNTARENAQKVEGNFRATVKQALKLN